MLLVLAVVLAIAWILSFITFHVTAGAIHLLIIAAVIAAIAHLFMARSGPRSPRAGAPLA